MENFGKKIKSLLTTGLLVGTAASTMAKDAPKTVEKITPDTNKSTTYKAPASKMDAATTISYADAVKSMEASNSPDAKLEKAKLSLALTQAEFKSAHAHLLKIFAHDKVVTEKLNQIKDYYLKLSVFSNDFLDGKSDDLQDTTKFNALLDAAKDYSRDIKTNSGKDAQILKDIMGLNVGTLDNPAGYNGDKDINGNAQVGAPQVSKDQTTRALWVGENNDNIVDRLLEKYFTVIKENAAKEKSNSMDQAVNNINNLASK